MKKSFKLVGSDGSLESLIKGISKWFFGSQISLQQINSKEWDVYNSKGLIEGVRVISKGKRYRFEIEVDYEG